MLDHKVCNFFSIVSTCNPSFIQKKRQKKRKEKKEKREKSEKQKKQKAKKRKKKNIEKKKGRK